MYVYDDANRLVGGTWARTVLPPALNSTGYDAANRHLTGGAQEVQMKRAQTTRASQPLHGSPTLWRRPEA
jgi:hypothetical protein